MLAVVLLPLFIARSMLPIGLMLSFEEGVPRLVLCPGTITVSGQPGHAQHDAHLAHLAHQGHQHHHDQDHLGAQGEDQLGDNAGHGQQICPFAFAGAAPLASGHGVAFEPPVSEKIAAPSATAILFAASRAHPIRGPPALS
jgi:hypothetical protein